MSDKNKALDTEHVSSQAIVIKLPVTASGTGQMTHDGQAVEQSMEAPTTAKIVPGVLLFHRVENRAYEVVSVKGQSIRIKRSSDGAQFTASLADIKRVTWLVTYQPSRV